MTQSTGLTLVPRDGDETSIIEAVDVEKMKLSMDAFHAFVKSLLVKGIHYGTMPGVRKDFLLQPGAEEIFRAFNCRPEYFTEREILDRPDGYVMYHRKCRAINIATGLIVGEADAICSSDEGSFRPKANGEKQNFGTVISNVLMKADKRAFVKAARTLGCASEFFTQDEELVENTGSAARESAGPTTISCKTHGKVKPVLWNKDGPDEKKQWKCPRKNEDGQYCTFSVPYLSGAPKATPAPAQEPTAPSNVRQPMDEETKNAIADAFTMVKAANVSADDLRAFFGDTLTGYPEGGPVNGLVVKDYMDTYECSAADWANAVIERFAETVDDAPIEGEARELPPEPDADELPFE